MAPAAARSEPPLPYRVLEYIFLRLDGAADLARASAACTSFRRVARARRFLRRFRSLHPSPVLAFLRGGLAWDVGSHPDDPPRRSAAAARALAQAADLTFSFLPNPGSWLVRDVRDGRVLLSDDTTTTFAGLVVADPLHRRYVQIPTIPGDIVPARFHEGTKFEPFLAPALEDEDSSFRLLYNAVSQYKVMTFQFSSVNQTWRHATSFSLLPDRLIMNPGKLVRYCVHNFFYWAHPHDSRTYMLVLDPIEMKFSIVKLLDGKPSGIGAGGVAIVDAGKDRLGMLTLCRSGKLDLYCKTSGNDVDGTEDWQHDKTIHLPDRNRHWVIIGAAEGYLFMQAYQHPEKQYFILVLDLKTLLFERIRVLDHRIDFTQLYASFPPPLSPPSI